MMSIGSSTHKMSLKTSPEELVNGISDRPMFMHKPVALISQKRPDRRDRHS